VLDRSELRQRFEREARVVSSLNHPHICALYDIGQQNGVDFLVMEYLEGQTLSVRLAKGALPRDQVLRYAIQICGALAQAHKATGIEAQGGHAEYMLMNADATYLIPDKVSYEQAAPIFCAGYTVYSGLRWADPQPHERVAVLGSAALDTWRFNTRRLQASKPSQFRTPPIKTR
jgi:hypothetical protein